MTDGQIIMKPPSPNLVRSLVRCVADGVNGGSDVRGVVWGGSLPAQESYDEAHQQNAQPLHHLPAGTNILALLGVYFFVFSLISRGYTMRGGQTRGPR